jgi:hypothetical protein
MIAICILGEARSTGLGHCIHTGRPGRPGRLKNDCDECFLCILGRVGKASTLATLLQLSWFCHRHATFVCWLDNWHEIGWGISPWNNNAVANGLEVSSRCITNMHVTDCSTIISNYTHRLHLFIITALMRWCVTHNHYSVKQQNEAL